MRSAITPARTAAVVVLLLGGLSSRALASFTPPDLAMEKTANVTSVQPGDLIDFSLYLVNRWRPGEESLTAHDIRLTDILPVGLTLEAWTSYPLLADDPSNPIRPYCDRCDA